MNQLSNAYFELETTARQRIHEVDEANASLEYQLWHMRIELTAHMQAIESTTTACYRSWQEVKKLSRNLRILQLELQDSQKTCLQAWESIRTMDAQIGNLTKERDALEQERDFAE